MVRNPVSNDNADHIIDDIDQALAAAK